MGVTNFRVIKLDGDSIIFIYQVTLTSVLFVLNDHFLDHSMLNQGDGTIIMVLICEIGKYVRCEVTDHLTADKCRKFTNVHEFINTHCIMNSSL